jgi:penicillin-binding protein 2
MGLEKAYNSLLSRQSGQLNAVWSVDALGNILLGEGIEFERKNYPSNSGVQLTIDLKIQKIAENALKSNIDKGAVVILDCNTNEILAMASYPTFNPLNLENSINDSSQPFINRAITPYSVGSIFKPIVASVAIENNINLTYNCTGTIKIGSTHFSCSNHTAHGEVNMQTATEKSCNTYFIALGQKTGAEKLISLSSDFGLGKEIELADNFYLNKGNLPTANSINSPQALANLSFGQGELLASPLQMAVAYSVFANGGFYRPPTLMKAIIDEGGKAIQKVKLPEKYRILNSSTISRIDSYLESVVTNGNGNKAFSTLVSNHGKTATAQSGWYKNSREINHTWFCGYFTAKEKTYVVVVFKEDGISGANDCAPSFKVISEDIIELE